MTVHYEFNKDLCKYTTAYQMLPVFTTKTLFENCDQKCRYVKNTKKTTMI